MAHGQPDYGMYSLAQTIYKLTDMGELAARLGSIDTFDRRGDVVWFDDFEAAVLRWIVASSVGSPDPILSTTQQWMGVQSVYYATVAGAGEYSEIQRNFPLIRLGKVGLEIWVNLAILTPGYFMIRLNILDGTNFAYCEIRLDSQARTASIVTPLGTIVIATTCFPAFPTRCWMPVKVVVDMDTDLYTRLLIGNREYNISAHALVPGGLTTDSYMNVHLWLEGGAVGAMSGYTDTFILTQNEP